MLEPGTGAGVVKPEVAAGCKDERMQEHQVGEELGKPVELLLVTDGVNVGVLLSAGKGQDEGSIGRSNETQAGRTKREGEKRRQQCLPASEG